MIVVDSQRGSSLKRAAHLTNDRDSDHMELHGLHGYTSDTLRYALQEAEAIAKRPGKEARVIMRAFREACTFSDSAAGFVRALEEKDYVLARGDRGGYVALGLEGEIQAVPKWAGRKAKQVRARLRELKALPSVAEAKAALRWSTRPVAARWRQSLAQEIKDLKSRCETEHCTLVGEQRQTRTELEVRLATRQEAAGKSIRGEIVEQEFEALLKSLRPSADLFELASALFRDLWEQRIAFSKAESKSMTAELSQIDRKIDRLVDRLDDADSDDVVCALQKRIGSMETDKAALEEQKSQSAADHSKTMTRFSNTLWRLRQTLGKFAKTAEWHTATWSSNWPSRTSWHTTAEQVFEHPKYPYHLRH